MHAILCDVPGCEARVYDPNPAVIDVAAEFHGWAFDEDRSGDHRDFCPVHVRVGSR